MSKYELIQQMGREITVWRLHSSLDKLDSWNFSFENNKFFISKELSIKNGLIKSRIHSCVKEILLKISKLNIPQRSLQVYLKEFCLSKILFVKKKRRVTKNLLYVLKEVQILFNFLSDEVIDKIKGGIL